MEGTHKERRGSSPRLVLCVPDAPRDVGRHPLELVSPLVAQRWSLDGLGDGHTGAERGREPLLLLAQVEALVQEEGRRDEERGRDDDGADPVRVACRGTVSEELRGAEEEGRRVTHLRPSGLSCRAIDKMLVCVCF